MPKALHISGTARKPPLTPVSEAESDTTETASTSNATSSSATSSGSIGESYFQPRPLNFSRPRPVDFSPAHRVHHDRSDSCSTPGRLPRVRSFGAFDINEQSSSLPNEPHFAVDIGADDATTTTTKTTSTAAGTSQESFAWEDHLKDMKPRQRNLNYDAQRTQARSLYKPSGDTLYAGVNKLSNAEPRTALPQIRPASAKVIPPQKIPPAAQDEDDWDGEDARSHHTVSENGDVAELEQAAWVSSSHDISSLSESEIKKLKKKGINPALYAEMKAARRGKGKWINPLSGNTYLS